MSRSSGSSAACSISERMAMAPSSSVAASRWPRCRPRSASPLHPIAAGRCSPCGLRLRLLLLAVVTHCSHIDGTAMVSTPPRGWNSYDAFTWRVTEAEFLENCEYVSTHLLEHGFEFCVIDYLWFQSLNATAPDGSPWAPTEEVDPMSLHVDSCGRPLPAPDRWPSSAGGRGFAPVAAKVHALGLKLGIHVMRGALSPGIARRSPVCGASSNETLDEVAMTSLHPVADGPGHCPWYPAAVSIDVTKPAGARFYDSQYELFASWGVDFIKNDCVFGNYVPKEIKAQSLSISRSGRQMVYSVSPGVSDAAKAREVAPHVNMYRLTSDVWDNFKVSTALADVEFVTRLGLSGAAGLHGSSWPDMDMLPFGYICSQNAARCPDHVSRMAPNVQRATLATWAIAGVPLFFDGDCRKMDAATLSLLTMNEVLEVNSAAKNRTQLYALLDGGVRTGGAFAAQSSRDPGTWFVLLLHPGGDDYPPPLPRMSIDWTRDFGLPKNTTCTVRDLFNRTESGLHRNNFTAVVDTFMLLSVHGCVESSAVDR